ncbi:MAG: class IV adenylate cyclase [Candidatus Electryonea clarkiae]|nr:class IV adenylate cyclase [Candidatus Electryonea clarkiae]MDP8285041.1 class IV adenylate cyclase [Candidatus Electryonea clarkiae]
MSKNIEIKAKANDFQRQITIAKKISDDPPQHLFQEDTFFNVSTGRLKLREFGDGTGELIKYERSDSIEPSESNYIIYPTDNPDTLKEALTKALGVRSVVRKKRIVYHTGQTRIHFDDVEDLGLFIELEVVLEPGEKNDYSIKIAEELMTNLEINHQDLVESAYVDLLENKRLK